MKCLLNFLVMLLSFGVQAQFSDVSPQPYSIFKHPEYQRLKSVYSSGDYQTSAVLAVELSERYFVKPDAYSYFGKCLMAVNKTTEAAPFHQMAYYLEPTLEEFQLPAVQAAMYSRNLKLLDDVLKSVNYLPVDPAKVQVLTDYLNSIATNFGGYANYSEVRNRLVAGISDYRSNFDQRQRFFKEHVEPLAKATGKDIEAGKGEALLVALKHLKTKVDQGDFPVSDYYYHLYLFRSVTSSKDQKLYQSLKPELLSGILDKRLNPAGRYLLYSTLLNQLKGEQDYERIVSLSTILLEEVSSLANANQFKASILTNMTDASFRNKNFKSAFENARSLTTYLPVVKQQELKLRMYSIIVAAMAKDDAAKAAQFALEGQRFAESSSLLNEPEYQVFQSAVANLQMKDNNKVEAFEVKSGHFKEYYNRGVSFIQNQDYANAVGPLLEAKKLIEKILETTPEKDQNGVLTEYAYCCAMLAGCYSELNKLPELFGVSEDMKSMNLAGKTAGKGKKRSSLADLQKSLKPEEAYVGFVDISIGADYDGVYLGIVVTREGIHRSFMDGGHNMMAIYASMNPAIGNIETQLAGNEFRSPSYTRYQTLKEAENQKLANGELGLVVELYRHFLNPTPEEKQQGFGGDMTQGMGRMFYRAYFEPFESFLSGKKRLIISPDSNLFLLPFETFFSTSNQYLAEKYDITYINSGTALTAIRSRAPRKFAKNVCAFGDAKYSDLGDKGRPLGSLANLERLRTEVLASIEAKKHVYYAFATFSPQAANYLIGTKAEVEKIKSIVPNTDLFMDSQMTENRFKQMSESGQLNQYRVLHLASHGLVHPYIFELSGIMFSTYPQPVDGEDGFLIVDEVKDLKIQPDFVMLSACQTGLGKLVPGAGISGLNQSFLSAGANATLTSLWPVNDYGTSVFVENLYKKVFLQGQDFAAAVNNTKREFINGVYGDLLRDPDFWAPFVYYGK